MIEIIRTLCNDGCGNRSLIKTSRGRMECLTEFVYLLEDKLISEFLYLHVNRSVNLE